jgi:NAD(P)-dependent dehydrogenase (short-subunit alcohol dehydrogenase family)
MLTRVLAVELATCGVTANALAPGAIETDLVAKMHSETTRRVYRRAIPADRYGTPEEVAAAAVFLASPAAAYVNGHVLAVDGGFLAAGVLHKD